LSIATIAIVFFITETTIDANQLRKTLSTNIRVWRKKLGISQEKLAEAVEVSTQTINDIECCRSWVSDKTMARLAEALGVEVFQLFVPPLDGQEGDNAFHLTNVTMQLRQDLKADLGSFIDSYIDNRFSRFLSDELPRSAGESS
jgi:transcriptional regulator with XRE-family HTH domain